MSSFCRSKIKLCLPLRHYTPKRFCKHAKWTKIRMYSSNFTWRGLIFAACFVGLFIITFLRVHRVEGDISEWPPKPAGSQWKERIPSNMLMHNVKQHSSPRFICHHSVRGLTSIYVSLFKAQKMIMTKPSLNLLSIFHLCKSKGQIYLLLNRRFLLAFRHLPLKMWWGGEYRRGKQQLFS